VSLPPGLWLSKERRFFEGHGRYTTLVREVDLMASVEDDVLLVADPNGTVERHPEPRSRYSADTVLAASRRASRAPPSVLPAVAAGGERIGITGQCPSCSITLACIENLDEDSDFSVWTVSTHDRTTESGEMIRAGVPYLEHDDQAPLEGAPAYAELIR
jgi:hypothetical protein